MSIIDDFTKQCRKTWRTHLDFAPPAGHSSASVLRILNACIGLSGELGEVQEPIKKWIFHGKELDRESLKKEVGDVMYYLCVLCHELDLDLDECMKATSKKLSERYNVNNNLK